MSAVALSDGEGAERDEAGGGVLLRGLVQVLDDEGAEGVDHVLGLTVQTERGHSLDHADENLEHTEEHLGVLRALKQRVGREAMGRAEGKFAESATAADHNEDKGANKMRITYI